MLICIEVFFIYNELTQYMNDYLCCSYYIVEDNAWEFLPLALLGIAVFGALVWVDLRYVPDHDCAYKTIKHQQQQQQQEQQETDGIAVISQQVSVTEQSNGEMEMEVVVTEAVIIGEN